MMKNFAGGMKRALALVMSVFMLLSQFALPLTALAQDVSSLPQLRLHYMEGETALSVDVWASPYDNQAVYWATLPASAFAGVTLEILPGADQAVTYNSTNGTQFALWDSAAVDGNAVTMIEIYRDGVWQASYPLYVSSLPLPEPPPPAPVPATITVRYVDSANGADLYNSGAQQYLENVTFTPDAGLLPANYAFDDPTPVSVTVYGDGTASHSEVVFYATYQRQPATITVRYVDSANGAELYNSGAQQYMDTVTFTPDAGLLPANYAFDTTDSVTVEVYGDGTASQNEVVFYATYQRQPATINVRYVDSANGAELYNSGAQQYMDTVTFTPDAGLLPANYAFDNTDSVTVEVYGDGTASQNEVVFYATYQRQPATITVRYVDSANGAELYNSGAQQYMDTVTFTPDAGLLPANYAFDNTDSVTVEVYGDGTASHSEVVFYATYQRQPATITVRYVDSANGAELYNSGAQQYMDTVTFTPDAGLLPANYAFDNTDSVTVEVYGDGTASHTEVVFKATYHAPDLIASRIVIRYVDSADNRELYNDGGADYYESFTVTPDANLLPADYQFNDPTPVNITVNGDGTASHTEVIFYATYYAPQPEQPPQPIASRIVIRYVDSADNRELYNDGGADYYESFTVTPDANLLPADYQFNDPTPVNITVNGDGTASHTEVIFYATYYAPQPEQPPQPIASRIVIRYLDSADNHELYNDGGADYYESFTVTPDANLLPADYQFNDPTPVNVTVNGDGTASHTEVIFYATYYAPQPEQPPQPVASRIVIRYLDSADNRELYNDGGADYYESFTVTPDANLLPADYQFNDPTPVNVTVNGDGTASHTEVVFYATYYAPQPEQPPQPVASRIAIRYADSADNSDLYNDGGIDYYASFTVSPDVNLLPQHYTFDDPTPISVTVNGDGTASHTEVVFYATYREPQPEPPTPSTLPDGVTLVETINGKGTTNTQGLNVRAVPNGDVLGQINVSGTEIEIYSSVNSAKGELWYQIAYNGKIGYVMAKYVDLATQPAPVASRIAIRYIDSSDNRELYTDGGKEYLESFTVTPDANLLPQHYTFDDPTPINVTVNGDGTASHTEVVFKATYHAPEPVSSRITIRYVDSADGHDLFNDGGNDYYQSFTVTPDANLLPQHYTFDDPTPISVTVNGDGTASHTEVVFKATYHAPEPVSSRITIRYVDSADGHDLFNDGGNNYYQSFTVTPDANLLPQHYTFDDPTPINVTVNGDGTASHTEVVFKATYHAPAPTSASINLYFMDEANAPISEKQFKTLNEGSYSTADWKLDIPGYNYLSVSAETVTISQSGADVTDVVYRYQRIPTQATITFRYVDQNGNPVDGLQTRTETLSEGIYDTAGYAVSTVPGYRYTGASVAQVVVNQQGALPADVLFTYERLPDSVSLPISFYDGERQPLMPQQTITFTSADFGKTFDSSAYVPAAPEGYQFAAVSSETITIDPFGGLSPAYLEVTYTLKPKATARVTFEYLSVDGVKLADIRQIELAEGTHDVMEYAAKPEKYNFQSVSSQTVTITADGKAQPEVITFTYAPVKDKATLKVHYRSAIGEDFPGSPEIRELPMGEHTITPNAAFAPQGSYALSASTQQYTVRVGEGLVAEPNSVTFTYYDASVTADVTVRYQDSVTGGIIAEEVRKLTPGTHNLAPDEALLATKGNYVKSSYNTNTRVIVSESGVPDYNTILFYYEPAQSEDYRGYLLVTVQTSLRQQPSQNGASVAVLPVETVLVTNGQEMSGAVEWYSSVVQTGNDTNKLGWVSGEHVRRISSEEAAARIEEANQPATPEQNPGLYRTLMDGVPLRRYMTTASEAKFLKKNVIVTVSAQEYDEAGQLWHRTSYDGVDGYVRDGQLQKLTPEEVDEYLAGGGNTESGTPDQYDPNGASSYGYVNTDKVNFRSEPGGTRLKMLNKYAMALIVGTREIDGVTWYNVNYSGQLGWIHGDYFHQMSLTEFTSFMGSTEYYQGITNNMVQDTTTQTKPNTGSTGSATQGNVSSVEDWNVGAWQNTGANTQPSYQPFNPYATPAATAVPNGTYKAENEIKLYQSTNTNYNPVTLPKGAEIQITGTVTLSSTKWYAVTYDGRTGYVKADELGSVSATPTPAPTSTFVIGTMIPIDYEDESKETQTSSVPWIAIGAAVVLVGGAGGVYAYALNQNKRRKAAAARAAAARRAQAQQQSGTSPYARRAVAAPTVPPMPTTKPNAQQAQQPVRNPYAHGTITPSQTDAFTKPIQPQVEMTNPYAPPKTEPASTNPYARPISAVPPTASQTAEQPVRRRATRMERYHAAENSENKEE